MNLVSDDPTALYRAVERVQAEMRGTPGLLNPYSTATLAKPEIVITPNVDKAAEAGVTTSGIADAIKIATVGDGDASLPKFNLADRQLSILVSLDEASRNDPAMLANLPVIGAASTVPLGAVADIRVRLRPKRDNPRRPPPQRYDRGRNGRRHAEPSQRRRRSAAEYAQPALDGEGGEERRSRTAGASSHAASSWPSARVSY